MNAASKSGFEPTLPTGIGASLSPEQRQRILQERAVALAQELPQQPASQDMVEVVEFLLAAEHHAFETRFVREVQPLRDYTPLPGVPPFILGIIYVRGRILSVINPKRFFGLPERGLNEQNQVIILKHEAMEFGVLTDAVLGVRSIPLAALDQALTTGMEGQETYLKGVTRERLIVWDAQKLLQDKRLIVHDQVSS